MRKPLPSLLLLFIVHLRIKASPNNFSYLCYQSACVSLFQQIFVFISFKFSVHPYSSSYLMATFYLFIYLFIYLFFYLFIYLFIIFFFCYSSIVFIIPYPA